MASTTARVVPVPDVGAAPGGTPPPGDNAPGGAAPASAPAPTRPLPVLRETALDTGTLHVRSDGSDLQVLPNQVSIRGTSGATQSAVGVGVTSIGEHVLPRDVFAVVPSTPLDLLSLGRLARLHGYRAFLSF
jgi:hypothetical protein